MRRVGGCYAWWDSKLEVVGTFLEEEALHAALLISIHAIIMAVTRLQRKVRKNKVKAAQRKARMKHLLATPVIKNVTLAELAPELAQASQGA